MHATSTDIELVRAYQAGAVEAFDELFIRYHQAIAAVAMRLVRDRVLAEDLVQETFLRVLRTADRVDADFNFSAWVHRIATNLCYDELRRQRRGQPLVAAVEGMHASAPVAPAGAGPDATLEALPSSDPLDLPEDALAMRELRREVWAVAGRLPEKYRRVLSLRELQGLSYAGIARVMEISESAVETLLHRARRSFKREYLHRDFEEARGEERCDALGELLASFPLADLSRQQRAAVERHAAGCPRCQELLRGEPRPRPAARRPQPRSAGA
jgi:RNA polymerase sigma-70 factor (ECF subfamily)